jgi:hypothetical protein
MQDAKTYRTYAKDCRRIAERMNTKDKAALIQMAELWDKHAEDAERQEKNNARGPTT